MKNRPRQDGFTLIEVMVAMTIGLFIIAATFTFMVHQNRLFTFTKSEVDRDRTGRMALDLLAQDVRHAGLGVGYSADGTFNGLRMGAFTVEGGASFNSNNHPINLMRSDNSIESPYTSTSDDIGIRLANGSYRSIVQFTVGTGEICSGGDFEAGDIIVFQAEDGLDAMTAELLSISPSGACTQGLCVGGCQTFGFKPDAAFVAGPNSINADYAGGELAGSFREFVWFVADNNLRRAEISAATPCAQRDDTCGTVAGFNVETLQMRVLQWDSVAGAWDDQTGATSLIGGRRIRVDLEMVVRTRTAQQGPKNNVPLQLEAQCLPDCTTMDQVPRRPLRTSVEIRNSGRLQLASGKSS